MLTLSIAAAVDSPVKTAGDAHHSSMTNASKAVSQIVNRQLRLGSLVGGQVESAEVRGALGLLRTRGFSKRDMDLRFEIV